MAGVPHITAGMLDALSGTLEGGRPMLSETVGCWVAESEVADLLGGTERTHEGCQIGSYPFFREGRVGANFVVRSTDPAPLRACIDDLMARLKAAGRHVTTGEIWASACGSGVLVIWRSEARRVGEEWVGR